MKIEIILQAITMIKRKVNRFFITFVIHTIALGLVEFVIETTTTTKTLRQLEIELS